MKTQKKNKFRLGNLIMALYEEAEKLTGNRRLQAIIVYLALKDLQLKSTSLAFNK